MKDVERVQLRKRSSAHAGVARRIRSGSKLHTGGLAGGGAVVDERIGGDWAGFARQVLGLEEVSVKPR